jgi:hypothetical protein
MGEEIIKMTNLREMPKKILLLMGKKCENIIIENDTCGK